MINKENIKLRLIRSNDFEVINSWENNPIYWSISGTQVPFSKDLINAYVNDSQDIYKVKQVRFIICDKTNDNEVHGSIDLFDFEPYHLRAGVGILINPNSRRKGIAEEALRLLETYAKANLNLRNMHCSVLSDNEGSIKLFEKAGFKKIGTRLAWTNVNGTWLDEHMYQKEL
ncbi:MAG: GNAT family N-acetyltransferase [Crocinitomicaceae bacterium]|nr:GNAT family N-acetyltransferase [Crocinitomicaceae bacterium]